MAMTGGTAKLVYTGYNSYASAGTKWPIKLYVYYVISQNPAANQSTIKLGMYFTQTTGSIGAWVKSSDSYLGTKSNTFDGAIPNVAASSGAYWLKENVTMTVNHDASTGAGSTTVYWKWGVNSSWANIQNPSGSFTLTPASFGRYTVSYDANGGSGAPSAQTKSQGITLTLSSTKPTRAGYTFKGWATSASGSVAYAAGGSYTADSAVTLYAVWQANTYYVTYDANGGTGAPAQQAFTFGVGGTFSSTKPTRTGYTFSHWLSDPNGWTFQPGGAIPKDWGSFKLIAQWNINSYSNRIDHWTWGFTKQEGTNGAKNAYPLGSTYFSQNYGSSYSLTTSRATTIPAGFTLRNVFGTSSISGSWTTYNMGTSTTQVAGTMSYEYDYDPISYSVSYELDGGTNNSSNPTSYNVLYGFSLANPTKLNYNFVGWYKKNAKISYTLSASSGNYNYYTVRTGIKPGDKYCIKIDSATRTAGTATQFLALFYDFTDQAWRASATVNFGNNLEFWLECPSSTPSGKDIHLIIYAGMAGATANNAVSISGLEIQELSTGISQPANSFASTDAFYTAMNSRAKGNITFVAKWERKNYTWTFDPNGGSVSSTTKTVTYGNTYTDLPTPTRSGYLFNGWYLNFDGVDDYLNFGKDYKYTGKISVHLKAYMDNWSEYNTASMRLISCTEAGGWNIEPNSGNICFAFNKGGSYINAQSSTSWASLSSGWHTFDLIHDGTYTKGYLDGSLIATSASSTAAVQYNNTNSIFVGAEAAASESTPGGSYFKGKIGSIIIQNNANLVSTSTYNTFTVPSGNITLIADWKSDLYTISYNANGGSGTMDSHTTSQGASIKIKDNTFTRTGYDFIGWTTKSDGTDDGYGWSTSSGAGWSGTWNYTNGQYGIANNKLVLYARWRLKTYTITYNKNGNIVSNVPSSQTKTHGTNITLSSTSPTRTRYKFLGWSTSSTATSATYSPEATFSTNANTTLYAVWQILDKDIYLYNTGKIDAVDFKTVSTVTELFDKNGYVYGTGFVTHSESNIYIGKDGKIYAKEFIKY